MKKIILVLINFIFIISVNALDNIDNSFEINSNYVYVYNLKENKVMYELDSRKKIPVASLTKIMTAIIAIENSDLKTEVIIKNNDLKDMYEYAVAGFTVGEKVTIKDLLYGTLLPSGSDAVNALVRTVTNSEEEFVKLMNKKVKELGLNNTHFSNPIGKDEGNYSSMYDISKILEYALNNKVFKEIFTTSTYNVNNLQLKGPLTKINSHLIKGSKTGFTYDAMYCLASFSQNENFDYIVVTGDANSYKEVIEDHENIYNYYYNNYSYYNYNINFNITIKNGKEEFYNVNIDNKYYLENNYNKYLFNYKYEGINEINKKLKKGDRLGKISVYYNDELLDTKEVILDKEIEYKNYTWIIIPITILLIFIIIFLVKKKKR